ncbi:MAG: hypothetical protein ACOYL6_09745 [Bacteriovoracaceae bacterium]
MKKLISLTLVCVLQASTAKAQVLKSQTSVIGVGVFLNIFKLPEELLWAVSKPFEDHEYLQKKEQTLALHNDDESNLSCQQKCFDDFRILKTARNKTFPESGENLLSFLNERSDFADHTQRTVGYCWGHSSVTRNFSYLAFYDPDQKLDKAPSEDDQNKFIRFYRHKIRKIMRGRAQIIPGFKNTREFSSHPIIKQLFKDQVVWKWADKALRIRSVNVSFIGKKGQMEEAKVSQFVSDVQDKLAINHVPKIFFTNLKKPGFIHVVNVYDVRDLGDRFKLCILDNHMYEDKLKDCGAFVTVKKDGSENYYPGWDEPKRNLEGFVGQFGFTPEDQGEVLRFQKENKKMCLQLCGQEQESNQNDENQNSDEDSDEN